MKEQLRRLFSQTLQRISLDRVIRDQVRVEENTLAVGAERIHLEGYQKIVIVALGKAAFQMTETVTSSLQPQVASGVIVSSVSLPRELPYFVHYRGGHPLPDQGSLHAARVIRRLLSDMRPHYLVLYLLSGGGSAICELPLDEGISLEDLREFYQVLVTCGAGIVEMNALRKHLSAIKGGRLAELAAPARQVTLYVSDVPPDKPSTVASGPTMPDESTLDDARKVAEKYELAERFPASVNELLDSPDLPETPKPGAPTFQNSSWHCLLDNGAGLEVLAEECHNLGWVTDRDTSVDDWALGDAAERLLDRLRDLRKTNPGKTVAVLTGGELSSPVTGDGKGGRNQAFVLECARRIEGENIAVLSGGTDGVDGNSGEDATGAVADGETMERAAKLGLDPADHVKRSDSYHFFEPLEDIIATGATGNNIRDLRVLVAW